MTASTPDALGGKYEARISIYRNGRRIEFNDALGGSPSEALYNAHNDLERWADEFEAARPKEFEQ